MNGTYRSRLEHRVLVGEEEYKAGEVERGWFMESLAS